MLLQKLGLCGAGGLVYRLGIDYGRHRFASWVSFVNRNEEEKDRDNDEKEMSEIICSSTSFSSTQHLASALLENFPK